MARASGKRLAARFWQGICAGVFVLAVAGCAGSGSGGGGVDPALRDEGQAMFGGGAQTRGESEQGAWLIVLATYTGEDREQKADEAMRVVRSIPGLEGAYVDERKNGLALAFGRYPAPDEPGAKSDLAMVREVQRGGRAVFSRAFLAPRTRDARAGTMPELDLANAQQMFGDDAKYTLQIGVYETSSRTEMQRAAEQAAITLRDEGELAFYYHGPNRSMVTIGVFGDDDFDIETGWTSDELIGLQERQPYNLLNGMGLRERGADGRTMLQRSRLVRIP